MFPEFICFVWVDVAPRRFTVEASTEVMDREGRTASWRYGYGSIPINTITIVGWTSILTQLFWCELQGYKVLTHCHIWSYTYIYIYTHDCTCIYYIYTHACTFWWVAFVYVHVARTDSSLARWICDERFIYHCDISCDGLHGLHLPHGMAQISQALHATLSTLPSGPSSWVSQSGSDGRWGLKQHTHSGILVLKSFIVGGLYFSPVPSCTNYIYI